MRIVLELGDWILAEDDDAEVRLWSNIATGETRKYEDVPIEVEARLRENSAAPGAEDIAAEANENRPILEEAAPAFHQGNAVSFTPAAAEAATGAEEKVPFTRQRGVAAAPANSGSTTCEPLAVPPQPTRIAPPETLLPEATGEVERSFDEIADLPAEVGVQSEVYHTDCELSSVEEPGLPPPEAPRPADLPERPTKEPTTAMLLKATSMRQHQGQSKEEFLAKLTHLHLAEKGLTSLGAAPQVCARLKVLNLEGNYIQELRDLRPICEVLHLQWNDVWDLSSWTQHLPSLHTLELAENRLALLSGLSQSRNLEELSLRGQRSHLPLQLYPPTLKIFSRSLRSLDISRNRMSDINAVSVLSVLERLDAGGNALSDIDAVGRVLHVLSRLSRLCLAENPLCTIRKYRDVVIVEACERLEELDGKTVQKHERGFLLQLHQRRRSRNPSAPHSGDVTPTLTPPLVGSANTSRSNSLHALPPAEQLPLPPKHTPTMVRSRSSSRDPSGRQHRRRNSGPPKLPPLPPRH